MSAARSMVLVLYVGAAWRAATTEQREAMRGPVHAAMQAYKEDGLAAQGIVDAVNAVMGDPREWMLDEDVEWITAVGGALKDGRQAEPRDEG